MEFKIEVEDLFTSATTAPRRVEIQREGGTDDDLHLTRDLTGSLDLIALDDTRMNAHVAATTTIRATCDRCLTEFDQPVSLAFDRILSLEPEVDEIPIGADGSADLGPAILEEIRLSLPMKLLCKNSCQGIAFNSKTEGQ